MPVVFSMPWARCAAILAIGIAAALSVGPLGLAGDYLSFIIVAMCTTAIAVVALTALAGLSGIWSLGHAAFMALGAYLAANLPNHGVPLEGILVVAAFGAAMIGFVLGLCAGRFSILYFGLLTLAISLAAFEIVSNWKQVTGGDEGIVVPPIHSLVAGRSLSIDEGPVVAIIFATAVWLAWELLGHSTLGRRWLAIKSQRTAAMAIGLVPHRQNALILAISAATASVSGICLAIAIGYLDPESFSLHAGVMLIVAAVVGGIGSLPGAIVGSIFIVGVPELARGAPDIAGFAFGIATILVLLFLRKGVVPSLAGLLRRGSNRKSLDAATTRIDASANTAEFQALVARLVKPAGEPLIVDGLSVRFGGVKALQDVGLTVKSGRICGLIGPNGAGKTTLLNVLSGYVRPSEYRRLSLGGTDLATLTPYARMAYGFGRTFQHAELFGELTVYENFEVAAAGARANARGDAAPLSAQAVADLLVEGLGLEEVRHAYPSELPFGIQKVVDIGRALAVGANVLALDEPFSGLDSNEAAELRAILRGLRAVGASILIIDHAVHEVLDLADEVVVLDFGQVLARGTAAEIAVNEEVRRAYFGSAEFNPDVVNV